MPESLFKWPKQVHHKVISDKEMYNSYAFILHEMISNPEIVGISIRTEIKCTLSFPIKCHLKPLYIQHDSSLIKKGLLNCGVWMRNEKTNLVQNGMHGGIQSPKVEKSPDKQPGENIGPVCSASLHRLKKTRHR